MNITPAQALDTEKAICAQPSRDTSLNGKSAPNPPPKKQKAKLTIPVRIEQTPLSALSVLGGLIVKGTINSKQKCPVCKNKFSSENIDSEGFYCPTCKTRPSRYYICAKAFGCEVLYSDPHNHKAFKDYSEALDILIALNKSYKDARASGKKFNPDEWLPAKLAEKRIDNLCKLYLKNHDAERDKGVRNKIRVQNLHYFCDNYIVPYFNKGTIEDIDRNDIEKFYHHLLDKKLSSKYIKHILDTLKSVMLRYRKTTLPEFPKFAIVPVREKQRLGMAREISIVDKIPERYGYKLAILILLRTGMRINEVCALKKHDFVDGIIYADKAISDGKLRLSRKSGGVVTYRVTPELWHLIDAHLSVLADDAYAFSIDGKPIKPGRLYKVWLNACSDAKVKPICLQHASRHSRASEIMEEHKLRALKEIQKQLGHNNISTGERHYVIE